MTVRSSQWKTRDRCLWQAFVAAFCLVWLTGCASTRDADNLSERPWNAPRSWEHGLPAGMFEGR